MHASIYLNCVMLIGIVGITLVAGFFALTQPTGGLRSLQETSLMLLAASFLTPFLLIVVGYYNMLIGGGISAWLAPLAFVASLVMALGFHRWGRGKVMELAVAAGATILLFDLAFHLSGVSPLAFALVTGSRFYGMGNEYAALIVVSLLLLSGMRTGHHHKGSERWQELSLIVIFILATIALGHARCGANFGGSVTAAAALGTAAIATTRSRWTWKQTASVLTLTLLAATISGLDLLHPSSSQSHIGRTFSFRLPYLLDAIHRKLAMNQSFIASAPLSLLAFPLLLVFCLWIFSPARFPRELDIRFPLLRRALFGAPVGMMVGFLINDSGIVVLGLMLSASMTALCGLMIEGHLAGTSEIDLVRRIG